MGDAHQIANKFCTACGGAFSRRPRDSVVQWESRAFCSIKCANSNKIPRTPIEQRLMRHIEMCPITGCWIWTGAKDGHGYGQISMGYGKAPEKAHRASYRAFVGEIPSGLVVRHRCDTPACINPNHLQLGTQKDNVRDMVMRNRMNKLSLLNLRPGSPGYHGAGPCSNVEIEHG